MDLIVDSNILFSALIKDGVTSNLLFHDELRLYAPEYLLIEFQKHKNLIKAKTERSDGEFDRLMEILQRRITVVPAEEILPHMREASNISPDPSDSPFFALAILLGANLWSNDKKLKTQKRVLVLSTEDLIEHLSKHTH